MLLLIGLGLGTLLGYLLTRSTKPVYGPPPPPDYALLRQQAAAEIDLWVDQYPEHERHIVRGIASNMRNGILPHAYQKMPPPEQSVATGQSAVPVQSVAATRVDNKDDIVSILAYLGAFVVVAGITVFSVQAVGIMRFLLLVCMSALFYMVGLWLRSVASLVNVANTFLAIGLIAAPFAVLSVGEFVDISQPVIWLLSSIVCTALYGATATYIQSSLLHYIFLASVFVTGQTATATLTSDFSWFMLSLSATGLLVAIVRQALGGGMSRVRQTDIYITQIAVIVGSTLSAVGLFEKLTNWPIVTITLLVSAAYFLYSGTYENANSKDAQTSWILAQALVVVAIVLGVGASQESFKAVIATLLLVGGLYSLSLPYLQEVYVRTKAGTLHSFHVAMICFMPVLAFMFSIGDEWLRFVSLVLILAQYGVLHLLHGYKQAAYGWALGLVVSPLVVFSYLSNWPYLIGADVYALAYGALVALFLWLWLGRGSGSLDVSPYNLSYGIAAVALLFSAGATGEQAMALAFFWVAAAMAIATWRTRGQLLPSLALASLFTAFCIQTAYMSDQPVAVSFVLFVVAATSYIVARAFRMQFGSAWVAVGHELRIVSLLAVAVSVLMSLGVDEGLTALLCFYVLATLVQIESWLYSRSSRQLAAVMYLVCAWWTLGYNGVDNILAYTYCAAIYSAIIAAWQRFAAGADSPTYRQWTVVTALLAGVPVSLAALSDKETYALVAILQNLLIILVGLAPELKPLRWIGLWTIVALISLQLLAYGFLFLWFVGAVLIALAVFFALRHNQPLPPPDGK